MLLFTASECFIYGAAYEGARHWYIGWEEFIAHVKFEKFAYEGTLDCGAAVSRSHANMYLYIYSLASPRSWRHTKMQKCIQNRIITIGTHTMPTELLTLSGEMQRAAQENVR